jgi:mannose-6-phosphate isomerase
MPIITPVALPPNPVWRSYAGGRVLRGFRGRATGDDDHFPEDWLASTVRARNGASSQHPDEGLSRLGPPFSGELLANALSESPAYWLGTHGSGQSCANPLWKLLDSSVRLQFQAHPDAAFARRHLNSNAGKTECWYIISTRDPEAGVYLGFQRSPGREGWARMIREQDVRAMQACFDHLPVKPGDCYVVPAGTPHAIGAGVFMMELMEPTDWVVRCERANAGVTLAPEACFMGLDLETCLDLFDYRTHAPEEVRRGFQQQPRALRQTDTFVEEELIGPRWHHFFRLHRLRGSGRADWRGGEMLLLIAVRGAGELGAQGDARAVRAGETWLLPAAASHWDWRPDPGNWEFLLARLPLST